jgi:predicted ATPase
MRTVAITGGPGGGKSSLLRHLAGEPDIKGRIVILEESIRGMRFARLEPRTREFQCALVAIQAGSEDSLKSALAGSATRLLFSHRGTLDPCAFWQRFGNTRQSFFEMTGTSVWDHYGRYDLVLHMESAAVSVPGAYIRFPESRRPESIEEAALLDSLLGELWRDHPRYRKLPGREDFDTKLGEAMKIIRTALLEN